MQLELHWEETPEQKHERVNKILEKNTEKPLVCVSCLKVIIDRESALSTPYGPYHGEPFTCAEDGRDDADIPWYQK